MWTRIAATYRTWRGDRYRRLFWGLIKRCLCIVLALLKPIVKVPKIIVTLFALFKVVEIAKTIVVTVVLAKAVILLSGGIGFRHRFGCVVARAYWRPVMRGW
jgi:hypothetical protein